MTREILTLEPYAFGEAMGPLGQADMLYTHYGVRMDEVQRAQFAVEKAEAPESMIGFLRLLPGIHLDEQSEQTIRETYIARSGAGDRPATAMLWRGTEQNGVGVSIGLQYYGELAEINGPRVSFTRRHADDLLVASLQFDEGGLLEGGSLRYLWHQRLGTREWMSEQGRIEFDGTGEVHQSTGTFPKNLEPHFELTHVLAAITDPEHIDEPFYTHEIAYVEQSTHTQQPIDPEKLERRRVKLLSELYRALTHPRVPVTPAEAAELAFMNDQGQYAAALAIAKTELTRIEEMLGDPVRGPAVEAGNRRMAELYDHYQHQIRILEEILATYQ